LRPGYRAFATAIDIHVIKTTRRTLHHSPPASGIRNSLEATRSSSQCMTTGTSAHRCLTRDSSATAANEVPLPFGRPRSGKSCPSSLMPSAAPTPSSTAVGRLSAALVLCHPSFARKANRDHPHRSR
jgi:hypothetical protein